MPFRIDPAMKSITISIVVQLKFSLFNLSFLLDMEWKVWMEVLGEFTKLLLEHLKIISLYYLLIMDQQVHHATIP